MKWKSGRILIRFPIVALTLGVWVAVLSVYAISTDFPWFPWYVTASISLILVLCSVSLEMVATRIVYHLLKEPKKSEKPRPVIHQESPAVPEYEDPDAGLPLDHFKQKD